MARLSSHSHSPLQPQTTNHLNRLAQIIGCDRIDLIPKNKTEASECVTTTESNELEWKISTQTKTKRRGIKLKFSMIVIGCIYENDHKLCRCEHATKTHFFISVICECKDKANGEKPIDSRQQEENYEKKKKNKRKIENEERKWIAAISFLLWMSETWTRNDKMRFVRFDCP